jgi:hypothetical protein
MRLWWLMLGIGCTEVATDKSVVDSGTTPVDTGPNTTDTGTTVPDYELTGAPFGDHCKFEAPGAPILDAAGTFLVTGPATAPPLFAVGTWVGGTGSLNVVGCVPSASEEILDRLVFAVELVLFDIDDEPIDLAVADDATGVNVLLGTVTDWDGVTDWNPSGTFLNFQRGSSSFSELDKQGRLVGTIDVTATDPAGFPMTVDIDLTW